MGLYARTADQLACQALSLGYVGELDPCKLICDPIFGHYRGRRLFFSRFAPCGLIVSSRL
jgi:hypothetical protein